jgi:cytochrome d ubiquinol oxidase subunit I
MTELFAARLTMGFSLGFHIIFAAIGMTMPFLMCCAHYLHLRRGDAEYLALTHMWMKGVAILFAVGAVSGTVLSFELGLLWPQFMEKAGPIIGMPFSWEGTAFFLEAIAIGLYLYGRKRMRPWLHWFTGLCVGLSGFASGIFVVAANAWMNTPAGFKLVDGQVTDIDPVAAMFNPSWLHQSLHMQVAAFQAVGFAVAGIHATLLLRGKAPKLNLAALKIAMVFAVVASGVQPALGHFAAHQVAHLQPVKLAAMEGHFKTGPQASLYLGGWPDVDTQTVRYGLRVPGALSFLAFNDINATVAGLDAVPRSLWPPVAVPHVAFQIMVGIGSLLLAVAVAYVVCLRRGELPRAMLLALAAATPLGFVAIEAGWVVTEVGRQPWIVTGLLRTADALTPVPGMAYHFYSFALLYVALAGMCVWLFARQIQAAHLELED